MRLAIDAQNDLAKILVRELSPRSARRAPARC
jgi:hypothetical protein